MNFVLSKIKYVLLVILKANFILINDDYFAKWHHQMQETRNNYFESKTRNTTLHQAKTGKEMYHLL